VMMAFETGEILVLYFIDYLPGMNADLAVF
jgi:hypothetical protein